MESEEFYDSLEDDSEYDSIDNSIDKEQQHLNPPTDKSDDIIPFYDKDLSRSEINLSKSSSRCSAVLTGKKTANKSLKKTSENDGKLKSNSYLSMFLAKTNAGVGELRKSPGRCAMERLNLTSRSSVDSDKFEVNSLYLKFEETSDSSLDNHSTLREIPELVLSIPDSEMKLKNVPEKKSVKPKRKCRSPQTITTKIPELGKLGPEIPTDKLELLRRRQQYGKRVSQTNRIKMVEKKALQNLQQEIRNSRICL